MTIEELKNMQSWTLDQKIDHSVGAVMSFIAKTGGNHYVSFSGGKDSTVLLDLVRRFVDKDMVGVFCNTGNEYPNIVKFVRSFDNIDIIKPKMRISEVIEKYGFPLISKEVSQGLRQLKTTKSDRLKDIRLRGSDPLNGKTLGKIPNKWQYLASKEYMVSEKCCDVLKKRPFHDYRKATGRLPILGVTAGESNQRKMQYVKRGGCNSFTEGRKASYPLSIWSDSDIWEYIRRFDLRYCDIYDRIGVSRTGCMFCGFGAHIEKHSRFKSVFELYPRMYHKIMSYENNGVTYRQALNDIGVILNPKPIKL